MAIDKLNFSGINSGSESLVSPTGSLADRLMKYGTTMVNQGNEDERLKLQQEKDAYQKQRDTKEDAYRDADKKERLDDKNRLLQKDYNTANAMSAIENKDAYIAGRMSSEQKAIQDTMASATPEERLQMQQELKVYDPKASGQQWADTALSQSNVDAKDITNLKRDITKENKREEEFNKKLKADQANADRAYNLNKMQYDQTAQDKKNAEKAKSAGVSAFMNNNVENATLVPRDSKDGEMIIKDENLNAHKEAFNEFGNSPEMIKMKNELVDAQKNGGQIYTKEQLADEKFLYNEYSKLNPKSLQKSTLELKGLKIIEDEKKDLEVKKLEEKASAIERSGISDFNTPEENMNAKNKAEAIRSQILTINNERKKGQSGATGSFEDFIANTRASNAAKELDLKTKIDKYDSAYKTKDIELKNKFGTIKKENVYVPKEEKQYAQDIVTSEFEKAKKEGRALSADEQAAIVITAKDIAKNHQVKVDKAEDDAIKVRLKKMETVSDAKKTLIGTIEKENASIRQLINDAKREDRDKSYEYVVGGKKTRDKTAYIAELQAELYQNNNRIDKALETKD